MICIMFDERVFAELENNIEAFVGRIVDISEAPAKFSAHLNVDLAKRFGVSQQELTTGAIEEWVRKLAAKVKIEVIALPKEQLPDYPDTVAEPLRAGRIILLK